MSLPQPVELPNTFQIHTPVSRRKKKAANVENATKIAVAYLRVSTSKQMDTGIDIDPDGVSIATQRNEVAARARNIKAGIQKEFVEPGQSAQSIDKRKVFKEMLAYIDEHPEIDYVIFYARSRVFRNHADAAITKRHLLNRGVQLLSTKEDYGTGFMADAMEAVTDIMNEVVVRQSGEDIKTKLRFKAVNGGTIGRAKIGYLNVRKEVDGRLINTIDVDPERAPLVQQAWELYATGDYSLVALSEEMNALGLHTRPSRRYPKRPVDIKILHNMLHDPYYLGYVQYDGELYQGRHEPLVTAELFQRVQDVLAERARHGNRDRVHHHYLKGIMWCGRCHAAGRKNRILLTEAANGRGGYYLYFFCRGRQTKECDLPYLPVSQVEESTATHYGTIGVAADFVTESRMQLHRVLKEQQASISLRGRADRCRRGVEVTRARGLLTMICEESVGFQDASCPPFHHPSLSRCGTSSKRSSRR